MVKVVDQAGRAVESVEHRHGMINDVVGEAVDEGQRGHV